MSTGSKKLTTGLICLFLTMTALAHVPVKDSLVILKGHLSPSYDQSKIQLFYFSDKGRVKDSAVIHDGTFEIKNYIHHIDKAFVSIDRPGEKGMKSNSDYRTVFLVPGQTITFAGADWKDVTIVGGSVQKEWQLFEKMTGSATEELGAVSTEKWTKSAAKDAVAAKALEEKEHVLRIRQHQLEDQFIKEYPSSFVSWNNVQERSEWMMDDNGLLAVFNSLDKKYRNTPTGASAEMRIVGGVNAGVGKTAPDFTAMDTLGRIITLSYLRGEYVLVDFWASWCGLYLMKPTPWALGLAVTLVVAISTAVYAQNGLLIRNRTALEESRKITAILFDKTGTLTTGVFGVTRFESALPDLKKEEIGSRHYGDGARQNWKI